MRLNQYLARSGIASRRKAEDLIQNGEVSLNGTVVLNLATEVNEGVDVVSIAGKAIQLPTKKYYLLNKPAGYTCTRHDPHAARTIFSILPEDPSLITVGRLDRDTTGLLLVTNDGLFAQNIIHPSRKIEKEYIVTLENPADSKLTTALTHGVALDDGGAKAVAARVNDKNHNIISVTIEEGRKRIVKRMIKAAGNKVVKLHRIRIGTLVLNVSEGQYRPLTKEEIQIYA